MSSEKGRIGARTHEVARPESPDERPVTERQARYLAANSGVTVQDVAGKTLAEVHDMVRPWIPYELLRFRTVCGRVVKRDPLTGNLEGVPNATVHVYDTDCSFLGFFPTESVWWWLWPFRCRREEIATAYTDRCGNFCVRIPRWDIDRILKFRLERVCFPEIRRPNLWEVLSSVDVLRKPPLPPEPNPPDPPYIDPQILPIVREVAGPAVADSLAAGASRAFGQSTVDLREVLSAPAPAIPAPLPSTLPTEKLSSIANTRDTKSLAAVSRDDAQFIGPFIRCHDQLVAEWELVFDVPDITFGVTQDVDFDGDEETVYSESVFDVRWNSGPIPPVVLEASSSALSTPYCGPVADALECETKAALAAVGEMPLESDYHDAGTGFALRVNPPRPSGLPTGPESYPARTPYRYGLALHGCVRLPGAAFYRLTYERPGASPVPFVSESWVAPRDGSGPPILFTPDEEGWYDINLLDDAVHPNWLLNWQTNLYGGGTYIVRVEVADSSKNDLGMTSDPVAFEIDNSPPTGGFTEIAWRHSGSGTWEVLPTTCPVVERSSPNVEFRVRWWASAAYLRSASLTAGGCGGGDPTPPPGAPVSNYQWWHPTGADTSVSRTAYFNLEGAPQGVYTFWMSVVNRAFTPGPGAGPASDWYIQPVHSAVYPSRAIAVIDA